MSLVQGMLVAGRFSVEAFAGKGGMGEVFRARDVTTGQLVALKLLHAREGGFERTRRFEREARLLAELKHPGIVAYLAHGQTYDGRPFLAMEWLAGQDLSGRLASGPLRADECVTLLAKAAEALAVAHRRNVVHRDIKPSNLFLRDNRIDGLTLLDFGIARWARGSTTLTRTGAIVGTLGYMAPEQARGEGEIGPTADVFALGCVLFECLTGRPPFLGQDAVGVLAKILFDDIPPIETLRPDTPRALAGLLGRMLDRNPAGRPADAVALCTELVSLELLAENGARSLDRQAVARAPSVLTGDAMKLLCVVLAVPRAEAPSHTPASTETAEPGDGSQRSQFAHLVMLGKQHVLNHDHRDGLRSRLMRLGAQVEWLADGSLVVVVPPASSALDQAVVAARCALAVQHDWPEARVALTTGRGLLHERLPAGDVIDRAVSLLRRPVHEDPATSHSGESRVTETGVWLDELSAKLLEPRFVITTTTGQAVLTAERASIDESRPLLGRPTPCVGREQEIAILNAAFHRCAEDSEPAGALVVAPPGTGKSRLRHEFLRRLRDRLSEVQVLFGSGTPLSAGSPYGLLSEAFRRLCEVQVGDPPALSEQKVRARVSRHVLPADAARVGEFIAAMCGIAVEEPSVVLRAARSDPRIMTEQIQRAFLDLLAAECAARPCLLVLEDLHWGDAATVKLVDAALLELRERPLLVLAFARPEVHERFPKLWEARTVQRIRLPGLSKKAAERLVTAVLGTDISTDDVARIVEQAAGNALFLEEIIRAAAEGKVQEQPETVLAMLQARLSCLDSPARRVLCSGSVFGQTFWRDGVIALLGQGRDTQKTEGWLENLVQAELIEKPRTSRFPEDIEYRFRHVLVRDAAYGLLPEDDRALGHRLAGLFLERAGETDPVVLAEHAHCGGDMERAAIHYLHAAEQSYQADDHDGMFARVERGIACGARGEIRGRLLALKLEVCLWRQDLQTGVQIGKEALELLPRGSIWWNRAASPFFLIAGHANQSDELAALLDALSTLEPDPDAVATYCTAAGVAVCTLSLIGAREPALRLLARLSQLAPRIPDREALAHGHIYHCRRGFGYFLGHDPWQAYDDARHAAAAFGAACASRWHENAQLGTAVTLAALGECAEAERRFHELLERALRMNDTFALSGARLFLLRFLAERCAPDRREKITTLARQLIELDAMEATVGAAHHALARVAMVEGRLSEAEEAAQKALGTFQHIIGWRPPVYTTLIHIHLRKGHADTARHFAEEGLGRLESLGGSCYSDIALRLAVAEARAAAGDMDAAREALAHAIQAIETRASKIPDLAVRAHYLEILEHVRARELAGAWLDRDLQGS